MESLVIDEYAAARLTRYLDTIDDCPPNFDHAEKQFSSLLELEDLDEQLRSRPLISLEFEHALAFAMDSAYNGAATDDAVHLFLQRVLYRINRLKLFWYDDLRRYNNERSDYLRSVRKRIEAAWQPCELTELRQFSQVSQLNLQAVQDADPSEALLRRAQQDVAPSGSAEGLYFREQMGLAGYRRLLEIASLDGLVEASQLSRTLGGVGNKVHAMMTRLLVEEYGGGRLTRKHSSFFVQMLSELGMNTEPETYFEIVPWEVLAVINHSFLLSERKRFYLRYVGGLLYTEISVPAAFDNYRAAADRLGMSRAARGYWELHIKEDERHGRWMLYDVALPLAAMYPANATEIVLGYDQQKFLSDRAGVATARAVKQADLREITQERSNSATKAMSMGAAA
ncbi:MAG: iron-containing redox enzyme family protein [Acidobacteriota bacterium]|nr:iron-containing redox enzyme family protein [Acidobacteriota bacterium]